MNNEALEILGKINAHMREVITAINKKNMIFPFGFMNNVLYDPYTSHFTSGRLVETVVI